MGSEGSCFQYRYRRSSFTSHCGISGEILGHLCVALSTTGPLWFRIQRFQPFRPRVFEIGYRARLLELLYNGSPWSYIVEKVGPMSRTSGEIFERLQSFQDSVVHYDVKLIAFYVSFQLFYRPFGDKTFSLGCLLAALCGGWNITYVVYELLH